MRGAPPLLCGAGFGLLARGDAGAPGRAAAAQAAGLHRQGGACARSRPPAAGPAVVKPEEEDGDAMDVGDGTSELGKKRKGMAGAGSAKKTKVKDEDDEEDDEEEEDEEEEEEDDDDDDGEVSLIPRELESRMSCDQWE